MKLEEVQNKLNSEFGSYFVDYKYIPSEKNNNLSELITENYKISISYNVVEYGNKYRFRPSFAVRINFIEEIWQKFQLEDSNEYNKEQKTLIFTKVDINPTLEHNPYVSLLEGGQIIIEDNEKSINECLKQFKTECRDIILPFIPQTLDINWLDKLANNPVNLTPTKTKFISSKGFFYRKMIIAKYAGNPKYEEIYNWVRNRFSEGAKKYPEKGYDKQVKIIDEIYGELKNIKPLENPIIA